MAEVELPDLEEIGEMKKDRFSRKVALVTAVFAVILAITSLGGNNAAKEMMLSQSQSSDQWAFYQSKAMREHLYQIQRKMLEVGLVERGDVMKPAAKVAYDKLLASMAEEEVRFNKEKKEIEKEAKRLEAERDINMSKDPYFDFAEVLLQIAIVMSSVSILAGSRQVFLFSVVAAAFGTTLMLNGFLLLVKIPFLH